MTIDDCILILTNHNKWRSMKQNEAEMLTAIRKMRNALLLAEKEWRNVDTFELEEESPYEQLLQETEKYV